VNYFAIPEKSVHKVRSASSLWVYGLGVWIWFLRWGLPHL